jgi:hypothetical protein
LQSLFSCDATCSTSALFEASSYLSPEPPRVLVIVASCDWVPSPIPSSSYADPITDAI